MKAQYNKVRRLAEQHRLASSALDEMIEQRWGFNYSQTDDDEIIDTLDYGIDGIDYDRFVDKMNEYKQEVESGKRSLNA